MNPFILWQGINALVIVLVVMLGAQLLGVKRKKKGKKTGVIIEKRKPD